MVLSALLILAGGALALPRPEDCLSSNAARLAAYTSCGDLSKLNQCLSNIPSTTMEDVQACYLNAGCSQEDALLEARSTLDRCDEWARADDLKKRYRAFPVPHVPVKTDVPNARGLDTAVSPRATGALSLNELFGRAKDSFRDADCFDDVTKGTTQCDTSTSKGIEKTFSCRSVTVTESKCKSGMTCSIDKSGGNVCMTLQDSLDTAGVIIAIVFGVALALGIGSLTYLCCKDRKDQKRIAAKAEATALARAATKKQRSKEVRAPLMQNQDAAAGGAIPSGPVITGPASHGDPFGDGNRS
jgi:hypothetical protein